MRGSRHILAVVAVTTALCAGQLAVAAPAPKAPVAEMAARLVVRLSETFSRAAPANVRPAVRFERTDSQPRSPQPAHAQQVVLSYSLSPFHFRLPPPVL
jgi:hypothetical protein